MISSPRSLLFLVLTALPLLAQTVQARPKMEIEMTVQEEVVDGEGPAVKLIPAESTAPGDVLVYAIQYANVGEHAASDVVLNGQIPAHTSYIADSADEEAQVLFSIDGGETFQPEPVIYTAETDDGAKEEKTATPDMYTNIRWAVKTPIPAGTNGRYTYRVRVD